MRYRGITWGDDDLAIIHQGSVVARGTMEELRAQEQAGEADLEEIDTSGHVLRVELQDLAQSFNEMVDRLQRD